MTRARLDASDIREFISQQDDIDVLRIHYCYVAGSAFLSVSLLEDAVIQAMTACDRIRLKIVLGADQEKWQELLIKRESLQASTLGTLISILSKHGIRENDLNYLKWVKEKRDYFIHRFFRQGYWPGDLDAEGIKIVRRQLVYLERIFLRAGQRIWKIFGRADLMIYQDLGPNGALLVNHSFFEDKDGGPGRT